MIRNTIDIIFCAGAISAAVLVFALSLALVAL